MTKGKFDNEIPENRSIFPKNLINLHPTYDYFILNMKNIEESKNKLLSSTETHWIVQMGICIVYGIQKVETQQVKTLIGRIMDSIDLLNF